MCSSDLLLDIGSINRNAPISITAAKPSKITWNDDSLNLCKGRIIYPLLVIFLLLLYQKRDKDGVSTIPRGIKIV